MDFHPSPNVSNKFPQEIVDEVIDNLDNPRDLRACSLVSSRWLERSRCKLFANVSLNTWNFNKWRKNIPPGPNGIATYVRSLSLRQARSIITLEPETLMGIMDHLTSFRRLKTLILQDVNFDDLFDEPSLTQCFGHFGASVDSLYLHGIWTDMSTLLFFVNLFPNLGHLTINSPILSEGVTELPERVLPLRGTLRLIGLGTKSSTLLHGILIAPLHLEEVSITHSRIHDPGTLNRFIEACAPTLERLELTHVISDDNGSAPISLAPCYALKELTMDTAMIKRPSPWVKALLSTISSQATQFKRVTISVQRQLSSSDIGDQVHMDAWESVEDILYGLALKLEPSSKFELVFMANPTYDEEEIDLGEFLERFAEVGVVKFGNVW
ncbi:hypothetical protein BJ322DRAFT_1090333 [Thelephora terrestris]|uniref:F-box domain-containing protein n=1 Tax=Thelephora terrestris TaxID=56493 RepID=A0A9P6H498_9AGAM|nr:hypothetical protein BJ322DRAFT_1090333 [Thelephora terrestris]